MKVIAETTKRARLAGAGRMLPAKEGARRRRTAREGRYWPFLVPASALAVLMVLVPLLALVVMTFMDWSLTRSPIPGFAGADNYVRLFSDGAFWNSILRTLVLTIETVLLQVVLGLGIALLFNRDWPGMGIIRALFLAPMMVAPIFAGMIWRLLFSDDFGLIKYFILSVGLDRAPLWLGDPHFALQSVIIVNTWEWTAFVVLFLLAGLQVIPDELYEAARIDGAGAWKRLVKITIPLLSPIIVAVIVFRSIDTMKLLDLVYVLTAGGPASSTETVSYLIYKTGITFFDIGYAASMALIVLIVVVAMTYLLLIVGRKRR